MSGPPAGQPCWPLLALLLLAAAAGASAATVHTVIPTECKNYFSWQSLGMFYSHRKVGQPGPITRILCCTKEDYEKLPEAERNLVTTHWAPSYTVHPRTGDVYHAYNKPLAVYDWMARNDIKEDFVLVIDADMIMRQAFIPDDLGVYPGMALAAFFGYMIGTDNQLALTHVPEVVPRNDTLAGREGRRGDMAGGFTLMHRDDMRRVAPLWLKYTEDVRQDPGAWNLTGDDWAKKPGDKPWISEMYGYSYGCAKADVWHHAHWEDMLYPGYQPWEPPKVLHYGLLWKVHGTPYEFDKHWHFDFDPLSCPPWNISTNPRETKKGLFAHPPSPTIFKTTGLELLRDLLSVEPIIILNAAFCERYLRLCPQTEELLRECGRAQTLETEMDARYATLDIPDPCVLKNKDCEGFANRGECQKSAGWMYSNCRPACKWCKPRDKSEAAPVVKPLEAAAQQQAIQATADAATTVTATTAGTGATEQQQQAAGAADAAVGTVAAANAGAGQQQAVQAAAAATITAAATVAMGVQQQQAAQDAAGAAGTAAVAGTGAVQQQAAQVAAATTTTAVTTAAPVATQQAAQGAAATAGAIVNAASEAGQQQQQAAQGAGASTQSTVAAAGTQQQAVAGAQSTAAGVAATTSTPITAATGTVPAVEAAGAQQQAGQAAVAGTVPAVEAVGVQQAGQAATAGTVPAVEAAGAQQQAEQAAVAGAVPAVEAVGVQQAGQAAAAGTVPAVEAAGAQQQAGQAAVAGTVPAVEAAGVHQQAGQAAAAGTVPAVEAAGAQRQAEQAAAGSTAAPGTVVGGQAQQQAEQGQLASNASPPGAKATPPPAATTAAATGQQQAVIIGPPKAEPQRLERRRADKGSSLVLPQVAAGEQAVKAATIAATEQPGNEQLQAGGLQPVRQQVASAQGVLAATQQAAMQRVHDWGVLDVLPSRADMMLACWAVLLLLVLFVTGRRVSRRHHVLPRHR